MFYHHFSCLLPNIAYKYKNIYMCIHIYYICSAIYYKKKVLCKINLTLNWHVPYFLFHPMLCWHPKMLLKTRASLNPIHFGNRWCKHIIRYLFHDWWMVSNLLIFQPKSFQQWMVMPKSNAIKKGEPVDLRCQNLINEIYRFQMKPVDLSSRRVVPAHLMVLKFKVQHLQACQESVYICRFQLKPVDLHIIFLDNEIYRNKCENSLFYIADDLGSIIYRFHPKPVDNWPQITCIVKTLKVHESSAPQTPVVFFHFPMWFWI